MLKLLNFVLIISFVFYLNKNGKLCFNISIPSLMVPSLSNILMSLKQQAFKGFIWTYAEQSGGQIINFFSN